MVTACLPWSKMNSCSSAGFSGDGWTGAATKYHSTCALLGVAPRLRTLICKASRALVTWTFVRAELTVAGPVLVVTVFCTAAPAA